MKAMIRTAIGSAVLLGAFATSAHAYTSWTCNGGPAAHWDSNSVTMRASNVGFPTGGWRTALNTAINRVNQNPSKFRFNIVWDDAFVNYYNGENEIWWADDFESAKAETVPWIDCASGRIIEMDIRFNNQNPYTTSTSTANLSSYGGSSDLFQAVAVHELGHAMGLAHEGYTYNIMGQALSHLHANAGVAREYFGEDGSNGLVALYGANAGNVQDLSISHWRYFNRDASDGTSGHARTRVLRSDGSELPNSWTNVFPVDRGGSYLVEFSYENNGKSSQTTEVGYYISTNDNITRSDTRIGGRDGMFLGRNTVMTIALPVTIPSNLTRGQDYWLGAIVDEDSTLSEVTEVNNATYLQIHIN